MHQLIYTSKARPDLSADDLQQIEQESGLNNPSADLTGFLLFRNGHFLQFLEGPLMGIETLIALLHQDDRHHSLNIVGRLPIDERSFPRWRMRVIDEKEDALSMLEDTLAADGRGHGLPEAVRAFLRDTVTV